MVHPARGLTTRTPEVALFQELAATCLISLLPDAPLKLPPWATASGRTTEVPMKDEFTARQRAISLRLSGRSVKYICSALGRSEFWFHKWWRRYTESGAEGLYDLTRANWSAPRFLVQSEWEF